MLHSSVAVPLLCRKCQHCGPTEARRKCDPVTAPEVLLVLLKRYSLEADGVRKIHKVRCTREAVRRPLLEGALE